ncbi:MAG: molybdate ABC transporter permease subunit [Magnetococcales bacterium]|nr:molybdate ABC transporter permease subunit [Magnetococcales bacterium]NGZ25266.1 molybdate ABC transporter permease subunit [Magnetococcales bacterium]
MILPAWQPLVLTLQLATVTTLLLLLVGIPLAWWLVFGGSRGRVVVETLVALPLVLPPTVLGFYLLLLFSPTSWLGGWLLRELGVRLTFSFAGLVVGSVLFSLPFMIQPLVAGFRQLPKVWVEAARTLGKGEATILWRVTLPNIRGSLLSAIILTFAHTVGEFGVVLMLGGNIAGETRVASIALYHEVEQLNNAAAHGYALVLVLFSFVVLLGLRLMQPALERR